MVDPLDGAFHALADPTRRAMVRDLAHGGRTVTELAAPHAMSLAGASKHVKVLEAAGLLRREVRGRTHTCRLEPAALAAAAAHLGAYARLWAVEENAVTVRRTLAGTPAELYAAWTEPELMRGWFGTTVDADVRVGGEYRIANHEADGAVYVHVGRYLELAPPARLAFSFTSLLERPEDRISDEIVTVSFRGVARGRTELTVTDGWTGPAAAPDELDALRAGWAEWLDRLAAAPRP